MDTDGCVQMGMRARRPSLMRETEGASPSGTAKQAEKGRGVSKWPWSGVEMPFSVCAGSVSAACRWPAFKFLGQTYLFDCLGCAALFDIETNEVERCLSVVCTSNLIVTF